MESKVAQCKRQLDKTLSLLKWLLGIQVLGLGYLIWGWFWDTIDFNGTILPYYFFLVFLPTFAAWRNASEFGEDWDEPFGGRESESWQRWFKRKHQHGGKDVL